MDHEWVFAGEDIPWVRVGKAILAQIVEDCILLPYIPLEIYEFVFTDHCVVSLSTICGCCGLDVEEVRLEIRELISSREDEHGNYLGTYY